ncbi:unnamed protein product, partial [marine sediment metagenome]
MSQLIRYGSHALAGFLPVPGSTRGVSYRSTKTGQFPLDPDTTMAFRFTDDTLTAIVGPVLTFERSGNGTYYGSDALLKTATTDNPRFEHDQITLVSQGLMFEQSRTNLALWGRDLTNAAWTKTNLTTALDQTGIDGTANSASSLTATAGNGTANQVVTSANGSQTVSYSIKRLTGVGAIQISAGNGVYQTVAVTNEWVRFETTQSTTNPTIRVRVTVNGDSVAVDYGQLEQASFATHPILTTTTSVVRAEESCFTTDMTWLAAGLGTLYSKITPLYIQSTIELFALNDGSFQESVYHRMLNSIRSISNARFTNADQWSIEINPGYA